VRHKASSAGAAGSTAVKKKILGIGKHKKQKSIPKKEKRTKKKEETDQDRGKAVRRGGAQEWKRKVRTER